MLRRENGSEPTAEPAVRLCKLPKGKVIELYKPLDSEAKSLLHGVCTRLGYLPSGKSTYILSVDFADALDDLVGLLSSDEGPIIVQLGEMQAVSRHLAPMLRVVERERFEGALFTLLDILGLLTSSALVANRASPFLLLDYRRQYKRTFESASIWEALLHLAITCVTPRRGSGQNDHEILKKVLALIRNILAIPDVSETHISSNIALASSFGKHERVVAAMRECRLIEFLTVAAASSNDERDCRIYSPHVPLLVEIFRYFFCETDPDLAAEAFTQDSEGPSPSETERALQKEPKFKKPLRHGRFSGAFVVRLATGEDYVVAASRINERIALDQGKRVQHRARKHMIDDFGGSCGAGRSSERRLICQVAIDFVSGEAFNELVKNCQQRSSDDQLSAHLLRLMAWILRLARCLRATKAIPLDSLHCALSADCLVQQGRSLCRFLNGKQVPLLLAGLVYYREALRMLDVLVYSEEPEDAHLSRDIQSGLFYRQEVISIFRLILHSSSTRFSLKSLAVLVEVNHVLLKLLKRYCVTKGHVFVARPPRAGYDDGDDGEEGGAQVSAEAEREFFFDSFLADYATEGVVDAYCRLLRACASLPATVNRHVATMLNRWVGELKFPSLLYRASVMEAIHEALFVDDRSWRRANVDLLRVATLIAKLFMHAAQQDPLLMVTICFNHLSVRAIRSHRLPVHGGAGEEGSGRGALVSLPEHWESEEKIRWLVRMLVDSEDSAAVLWLCSRLFDAAAARRISIPGDGDGVEGMDDSEHANTAVDFYLHAQTGTIKDAFSQPAFCTLLKLCGCAAPSRDDHHWSLPGGVSAIEIIKMANIVQSVLRNTVDESVGEASVGDRDQGGASDSNGDDVADGEIGDGIPTTLASVASVATGSERRGRPGSRWETLKRGNFFLTVPPSLGDADKVEYGDDASSVTEDGENPTALTPPQAKRPPVAIYSDDDE